MTLHFSTKGRFLWGFAIELAFGVVILACAVIFTEDSVRTKFLRDTATDWLTVTGQVLFPASVAIWITYVNIESSSFGDYLRYRKANQPLHFTFAYPAVVFFVATLSLIFLKGTSHNVFPDLALFLLGYSGAVFLSMIFNVTSIMRLYGAFRTLVEREKQQDHDNHGTKENQHL